MTMLPVPLRPTRLSAFAPSPALGARRLGADRLALGLAGLGGAWGPVDETESVATLLSALERGIRVFDTAPAYGIGDQLLGCALAQWRGERPVISCKVGRLPSLNAHDGTYDYSAAGMRAGLGRSLAQLGLAGVDLLFLHEPMKVSGEERARVVSTLRQLQADGYARHLGLAGGHGADWDGFIETGAFDVVMLFRRLDPCTFEGLAADLPRIRATGARSYGASPLHMGLLGARYDEFVRERPTWVGEAAIDRAIRLKALADRHGLSLASLAHRFMFGLAELDRVVIGATNRTELDNALADFEAGPLPEDVFSSVGASHDAT